jgi:hypothetical protein
MDDDIDGMNDVTYSCSYDVQLDQLLPLIFVYIITLVRLKAINQINLKSMTILDSISLFMGIGCLRVITNQGWMANKGKKKKKIPKRPKKKKRGIFFFSLSFSPTLMACRCLLCGVVQKAALTTELAKQMAATAQHITDVKAALDSGIAVIHAWAAAERAKVSLFGTAQLKPSKLHIHLSPSPTCSYRSV